MKTVKFFFAALALTVVSVCAASAQENGNRDENGKIVGEFRPTGAMPTFFDTLKSRGMNLDPGIFQP